VPLKAGLSASVDLVVAEPDLALAQKSGDVPVLATPRLVALLEQACMAAVENEIAPTDTTVGMRVHLDHLAPTALGGRVTAEATVESVKGRRVTFTVSARDDRGLVAAGRIDRVLVDRERFLDKCR
jgi:fluoroacetyl-CoA thioesterase